MLKAKRPRSNKGFLGTLSRYYSAINGSKQKEVLPESGVGDDLADEMRDTLLDLDSDPSLKTSKGRRSSAYILLTDAANNLDVIASKRRSTKRRPMEPLTFPPTANLTSYDFYLLALRVWILTRLIGPQKPGPRPLERRRRRVGRPGKWDLDEQSLALLLTILERFRAAMAAKGMRPTNVGAIEAYLLADDQMLPPGERFPSAWKRKEAAKRIAKRIPDLRRQASRK
jgi:hypothetical protein